MTAERMLAAAQMTWTASWINLLAAEWKSEIPLAMHKMGERGLGPDGNPQWTAEFEFWLTGRKREDDRPDDYEERTIHDNRGPYHNSPARIRTTRAFRKLRRHSNAEYIVAYRLCVLDHSPDDFEGSLKRTARWLNERAVRKGTGEEYTLDGVALLAYAAVDKLGRWI
jgi:hypothetical protein